MGDRVIRKIMEYLKAHRLKRNWHAVLTSLAAVVVFCTTYALILPAITLDRPKTATASDAQRVAEGKQATPANAAANTTVYDDDPEADVDLVFDLDYDMATRRFLTKSSRDLGVDVDMGVPEWMLSDWDDVADFDGELTGIWSRDLLAVAESQVGYIADYEGKSYYGDWFGKPYDDWNAMFVSYCLDVAEVPEDVIPRETSAAELADKLADMEDTRFVEAEGHTPETGDLIFFDTDGDGEADRVGIVAEYDAGTGELKVIEGDYRTEVERYETDTELASASDAEEASSSNAKKAKATPSDAEIRRPGRGAGIIYDATPSNAEMNTQETSPLGATIEKKVTPRLTAQEDEEEEDEEDSSYDIISEAAIVSYDLEELLSGEESVSVVGYVLGAANKIDILDYIENYSASHKGNKATATIIVSDADNNEVKEDENGDYNLIAGEDYSIGLDFYFEGGIEAGTYVYTFPDGITLTDGNGTVTATTGSGKVAIGTWTIDPNTCTLTFEITEVVNNLSHITLSASASASFNNAGDIIEIGDITYQVIEETEDTSASLHKRAGEVYSDDYYITWEIEVDGGDDVGLAGQTITDSITTSNHEFTQYDVDDMTITIQDSEGTYHTLPVDDANLTWTETGWEITLPDEFTCKNCRETITLPEDDSTGWIIYIEYTTTITGSGSYVTYGNTVTFNDLEKTGKISTGKGGIDKGGVYNEGATWDETTITWTVEAFIPGNAPDKKVYNWYIYDSEDVMIGSTRKQRYYNELGVDSKTTTIIATIGTDEYNVPNIEDAANDGSDLIAWELHSTANSEEDGSGYDFGRTIWFYCWDDENGEWSLWWNLDEDTYLTITYSSSVVYEDENLIQEYNAQGASLRNSVDLKNKGTDGNEDSLVGETSAKVDLPSVIDKELTDEPDSDNSWVTEYTVTFNEAMADLSQYNEVTLTDTMSSSLIYDKGSTKITAKDADGNIFTVTDYTVSFSSGTDNNVATITLNDSALGPYEYTLVYNAKIDGSGTVSYSNAIEVTVFGKIFTDEVGSKVVNDVAATAQTYSVTLTKKDADTDDTLAGAEFDVYKVETDALLTTVTTGSDGTATVSTNSTQGIIFNAHTLYYFIETKAPDGYVLDNSTKYYFWFCDVDGECSTCDAMEDELIAKEGPDVNVYEGAFDSSQTEEIIEYTITNSPGKELPKSGGSGTSMYTMAGMLLTGCACFMYKNTRRKRRHEGV